ncbi:hypothetical protein LP419_39765 [Massilia sp. H-1]|nr:hypothetical protein LP419_39765 [Massilia sp. H-1]
MLGDDGVITFTGLSFGASGDGNDLDPSDIDEIVSTSTTAFGGADTIITGIGNDIILGGRAGDSIAMPAWAPTWCSATARASAPQPAVRPSWPSLPITLGILESIEFADGGDDVITGSGGQQIMLGGAGADDIRSGANADIIVGDNGLVSYVVNADSASLDLVTTLANTIGGADVIRSDAMTTSWWAARRATASTAAQAAT